MLNPLKLWAIYRGLSRAARQAKEMTMKNWITTALGILGGGFLAAANVASPHPTWQAYVAAGLVGGLGIAAKDFNVKLSPDEIGAIVNRTGLKAVLLFVALGLGAIGVQARAQTASTPAAPAASSSGGTLFTPSSQAMGFALGGNYAVGTDIAETLNITKTCGVEGHELLVPSMNLQAYLGGVSCTPDFSALLKKTLLPANTINFSFHGAGGIVRNTGGSTITSKPSAYAGGCVSYNPGGGAVVVPTCVNYLYAPGFGKSSNGVAFSAGIAYVFGH